jgi:hypothetical protein
MEDEVPRIQRDNVNAQRVVLILPGHVVAERADLLERGCVTLSRSAVASFQPKSKPWPSRIFERSPK